MSAIERGGTGDRTFVTDGSPAECPICHKGVPFGTGRDGRAVVVCRTHGCVYAGTHGWALLRLRLYMWLDGALRWLWSLGGAE